MRKQAAVVSFVIVLSMLVVGVAGAAANLPGSGWWSGEQVQNVGSATANVIVTAYDEASAATYSVSDSIVAGGSRTFVPSDFASMPDGFRGAAIIESDQPVKAIANITNRPVSGLGEPGGEAAGQYQGVDAPDTTLSFPLVKLGYYGKSTTFFIQNAGDAATTATLTFNMLDGAHGGTTPSINPGQMVAVNPGDYGVVSGNSTGLGALTVTASEPLAGAVTEHKVTESPATLLQATRGFTPSDYDTKVYAPIIKRDFYRRFTGIQVQNVSAGAINITVTYVGSGGACAGNTYTSSASGVAAGASVTFVNDPNLPTNCLASATVEGTGNIVAIVNEAYQNALIPAGEKQQATTFSCIPDKLATTKLSVPLYKENSFRKTTGLQVQNVGPATATNVVLTFAGPLGTYVTNPQTIVSGGSANFFRVATNASLWSGTAMPDDPTGNKANGVYGVIITSDQPIVAIANESTFPLTGGPLKQDKSNYEGFNLAP